MPVEGGGKSELETLQAGQDQSTQRGGESDPKLTFHEAKI